MLSCIYKGKPFAASENSLSMKQKYDIADKREFLCPCCNKPVFYCKEGLKIAHFVHYEVGDCPEGTLRAYDYSNTSMHENLTESFVEWVKAQLPDIEVIPDFLINRELKTDIYFELEDAKVAVEIQFKRISNPNFIKRRELYKKNGIKDIWFFVTEEENYPVGSPFHRTYYHDNKRELYFYQSNESNCMVYKGFAKEKWEKIGSHTLIDYVSAEVPLDHIKIKSNGVLIIPELYNKYLQKLTGKRKKNKQRRDAEKEYIERLKQNNQNNKSSYTSFFSETYKPSNNVSNFIPRQAHSPIIGEYKVVYESKPEKVIPEGSLLDKVKQYNKVMQEKAYFQEYKEYHFVNESGKEYLDIIILYQSKEYRVKYLIIHKTVSGKEMFLTCRKESEPENVRYLIDKNPFLDSMKKVKIQRNELN